MPESIINSFKRVGGMLAAIAGLATVAGGWVIIPRQVEAVERRLNIVEAENKRYGESLARIETKIDWLVQERKGVK